MNQNKKKPFRKISSFEERLKELKAYKAKHGHNNVRKYSGSLGRWCSKVRQSAKKSKNNKAPFLTLSEDNIKHLFKDIGFDFKFYKKKTSFEERMEEPQQSLQGKARTL